jgi:hypothetical protein
LHSLSDFRHYYRAAAAGLECVRRGLPTTI